MPPATRTLEELALEPLVDGHDIAARFAGLEELLPEGDGVRWFCTVHRAMSETVAHDIAKEQFLDADLLERLDVHLVALFLAAVAADLRREGNEVRRSWRPLFERRSDAGVKPIQFALAGINAHIATDLPRAVLTTCAEAGIKPERESDFYKDYCRINELETALRTSVEAKVFSPEMKAADEAMGKVDDHLETFGFWAAREAAWVTAEVMERLPDFLAPAHASALDRTTGYLNKVLLFC